MDGSRPEGQNLGPFLLIKYIKNYSCQNMSIIKVVLPFFVFLNVRNISNGRQGKERQSLKAQVLKGSHSEKSTPLNEAHIINDLKLSS